MKFCIMNKLEAHPESSQKNQPFIMISSRKVQISPIPFVTNKNFELQASLATNNEYVLKIMQLFYS